MRDWEILRTAHGALPYPKTPKYCAFDGEELIVHHFTAGQAARGFLHVDVYMKCPKCGWFVTFGVPIDSEELRVLSSSPLRGKVLTDEVLSVAKNHKLKSEIERRLKAFGYW